MDELQLSPGDFSNAATVLLVATIVFQLPGTLLIKKIHPNRQFSGAMLVVGQTQTPAYPLLIRHWANGDFCLAF